ncbi:hypothetical protein, partial [Streptomyces triticagri]|uniref:hypothetical protein n=1 Tax=Streptomyces triticagri TaxID=2293568 RepID=UPI001F3D10D5
MSDHVFPFVVGVVGPFSCGAECWGCCGAERDSSHGAERRAGGLGPVSGVNHGRCAGCVLAGGAEPDPLPLPLPLPGELPYVADDLGSAVPSGVRGPRGRSARSRAAAPAPRWLPGRRAGLA